MLEGFIKPKGIMMDFFDKLGKVLAANIVYTVVLILGVILFLYFAEGDLIACIFSAISALVVYVSCSLFYQEYKILPAGNKKPVAKKRK